MSGALYGGTGQFTDTALAILARHEADAGGDKTVSAQDIKTFMKTYDTDGYVGLSAAEAEVLINTFRDKSLQRFGVGGSEENSDVLNYNLNLCSKARKHLQTSALSEVKAPATDKPYDVGAARRMMQQHYPKFELLNMGHEGQINPQRVCLYWNDDGQREGPGKGAFSSADGIFDPVRQANNRFRSGVEEVGDDKGYPLYIRVPNHTPPEQLEALLDDLRSLTAYASAFPEGGHSRFASMMLHAHGNSGGILADGDGEARYDILPGIDGAVVESSLQSLELDRHAVRFQAEACEILGHLQDADIATLKAQVSRNGAGMVLNSTSMAANWSIQPQDGYPTAFDNVNAPKDENGEYQRVFTSLKDAGPGGNAFMVVPAGQVLSDGSTRQTPVIVRVLRKDDEGTRLSTENSTQGMATILKAWKADGGLSVDETQIPQYTVRYNAIEERHYQYGLGMWGK
jgi:hypothetical protein